MWKGNCEYLKGGYSKWWERLQRSYENCFVKGAYSYVKIRSVTFHVGSHSVTCHPTREWAPKFQDPMWGRAASATP